MLRDLKLNVFYPYSPERVWKAIANRRALAAWLMDNDFEPRLGHKFRFKPEQNSEDIIYCEVVELDEPKCLSYTWRGNFLCQPTIVTWRLVPVEGGTQLQLEHSGFESKVTQLNEPARLAPTHVGQDNSMMPKAILETQFLAPIVPRIPSRFGSTRTNNFDRVTLNFYLSGGWCDALNHRLPNQLTDCSETLTSHS